MAEAYRAGVVTVAGRPNVGKSTLVNRIVGLKVSIVSPRAQTTRRRVAGVRSDPDAQIVLLDTPGLGAAHRALERRMVDTARRCLSEADAVAALVAAAPALSAEDEALLAELRAVKPPGIVIINKIDLVPSRKLLPLAAQCSALAPEAEIVPVSALTGENLDELVKAMKALLPERPALMPQDEYTDQTQRAIVEELIREKILLQMRDEIPFSAAVKVEQWTEDVPKRLVKIHAVVLVERDSQKAMVIGAGGQRLKAIGTAARLETEQLLGTRVYLELLVKTERNWTRDPRKVAELGT